MEAIQYIYKINTTPSRAGARPLDERLVRAKRELAKGETLRDLPLIPIDSIDSIDSYAPLIPMLQIDSIDSN